MLGTSGDVKSKDEAKKAAPIDVHQEYLEKEMSTKDVAKVLSKYLWPVDHPEVKTRVLLSLGLLGVGKLLNVQV